MTQKSRIVHSDLIRGSKPSKPSELSAESAEFLATSSKWAEQFTPKPTKETK